MKLKPGVSVLDIQPELVLALIIINSIYQKHGLELVITSVSDGKHMQNSLHYAGEAADLRITPDSNLNKKLLEEIRSALDAEFDVILEPSHLHVEYDPDPKSSH